jgi:capsular polysaccharide transport system permease protein
MVAASRSSALITFTTWKALFLREAVNRLSSGRAAWLWLLLEPVVHIVFMLFIFTVIRMRSVGGIDVIIWLTVGMLSFFMFRNTGVQTMNAVGANQALFTYRQVKPVDTVLVRGGLEGFLTILVAIIMFAGIGLFGKSIIPANPLATLEAALGLWLFGLGFGLSASVLKELVPELGKIIALLMTPMYLFSGVIFPLSHIPQPYRGWLMINPIPHGLEAARFSFSPYYQAVPETSVGYLYACALASIFIGLALHVRYANQLIMK